VIAFQLICKEKTKHMKITKKKMAWGVAIIIALGVLWSVLKPAPAEAAEVTMSGSLNYRLGNDENSSGVAKMKAEDNGSAIGVNITEDLTDGVRGFAHVEVGIDTDDSGSDPFDSKLAYAGVEGDLGKLQAGRMDSVFKGAVTNKTSIFPEYGGGASQKLYSRDSHLIQYSTNLGGITFDTQIKVDGDTGKDGIDVLETAASIPLGGADIGVAMTDDKVNEVKYYGAGVTVPLTDSTDVNYAYTKKDFAAAASTDVTANEVSVAHTIDATTFALGYGEVKDGTKYSTVGLTHSVTESFEVYAGYEYADKTGSTTDTTGMSAGIKFTF
jgi:predicted porin